MTRVPHDGLWTIVFLLSYIFVVCDSIRASEWWNKYMNPIIGVPLKTQVRAIVRKKWGWQVWTGIDDMQKPYTTWTGTNIELHRDGTAYKVVVQPDGVEDRQRVM